MNKYLEVLGDGQIWDLRGILPHTSQKTFEDLFSGRALGQMAQEISQRSSRAKRLFSPFKEKGKITGLSVTKALLSKNRQAKDTAIILLEDLAKNASLGIKTLSEGKGFKPDWSTRERNYWRNLDFVIIGGGVSEGPTGEILVSLIKRYLTKNGLSKIRVYQAKFSGKEAGFQGAVVNILKLICNEGKVKGLKKIAAIGLDLGREEIGAGLLAINPNSGRILKQRKHCWFFKYSVKTPYRGYLKKFLDSRRDYTVSERKFGERIRAAILEEMANLIVQAQAKAQEFGWESARNIGVAIPGRVSCDGYIIDSTDYLPFFRKQDGFNLARSLEEFLVKRGLSGYHTHIINDGIAAGIANVYFDFLKLKQGKFAFFGVGSGLGGCVGRIDT